jgi:hypothetical protein
VARANRARTAAAVGERKSRAATSDQARTKGRTWARLLLEEEEEEEKRDGVHRERERACEKGRGRSGRKKRAKKRERRRERERKKNLKKSSPKERQHRHDRHRLLEEGVPARPRQVVRVEPDVGPGALRAARGVVVQEQADEARLVVLERVVFAFGFGVGLRVVEELALDGRRGMQEELLRRPGRGRRGAVAAAAADAAAAGRGPCRFWLVGGRGKREGEKKKREKSSSERDDDDDDDDEKQQRCEEGIKARALRFASRGDLMSFARSIGLCRRRACSRGKRRGKEQAKERGTPSVI